MSELPSRAEMAEGIQDSPVWDAWLEGDASDKEFFSMIADLLARRDEMVVNAAIKKLNDRGIKPHLCSSCGLLDDEEAEVQIAIAQNAKDIAAISTLKDQLK